MTYTGDIGRKFTIKMTNGGIIKGKTYASNAFLLKKLYII
jgi:hypothetical protein